MKKLNFFFFLSLFALTGYFVPGIAQNKAIDIPSFTRLEILDEELLGTHSEQENYDNRRGKSFTYSAWIKISSVTNAPAIMGQAAQAHYLHNGSLVLSVTTSNTLSLKVQSYVDTDLWTHSATDVAIETNVSLNEWTFFTIAYNADEKLISVYVNGENVKDVTVAGSGLSFFQDDPGIFFVGNATFAGACDEVQFYNKALTASEVKASMNLTSATDALIAWYDFNTEPATTGTFANKVTDGEYAAVNAVFKQISGGSDWGGGDHASVNATVSSPTLVDGREIVQQFTYTYTTVDGGSVTAKIGDNTIDTGEKFETGSDIVLTVSANADYELSSLLVNDVEKKNEVLDGTLTIADVTSDLVVKALFVKKAASYCTPVGTTNTDVYLAAITSSGAKDGIEINYTANSDLPSGQPYVKLDQVLTVQRGSTFTINYVGANSEEEKPQITCCHAEIFVDWNGDGVFEGEDEVLPMIGADAGMATGIPTESGRNLDVKNISQSFTVPEDAVIGQACIRIRYVDAWHIRGNEGADTEHGACAGINKGCAYDIILNITEGEAPEGNLYTYNTVAGGSVTAAIENSPLLPNTRFDDGSVIVLTVVPEENYELTSLLVNNEEKVSEVVGNTLTLPALSEDLTVVATFTKQSTPVAVSSAIHIPEKSGSNHYMFRFDDQLLGNHTNGSTDNDQRIRTFTMSAWVKTAGTTGDILGLVQSKFYVESGSFGVRLRNGNLELFSRCVTLPSNFGDDINVNTGVALPVGEWAFITAVIDDDNKTIALYKDGELVTQQNFNRDGFGMLPDKSCFFVGNMDFTGDIEDIQLWKGALTPEQIKASQAGYTQAPEDLLYYYKFNAADVDMTQFPNKGTGGECVAELAYGKVESALDPDLGYYVEMYVYTPQVPEYVQGHVKAQHVVTYTGVSNGGTFTVKNGDTIVKSGSSVDEGTWLTVEAVPEEDYLVKSIKVNGVAIEGSGFNLSEASEITVEFTNKLVYRYSSVEGGTVSASIGEVPLDNEGEFDRGSDVVLTVLPEDHYELSSLLVNGDEKKESLESGKLTLSNVQENITVSAVFAKKKYTVTFTSTGDGQLELKNGSSSLSSGALVEYGTELTGSLVYSDPTRLSALTNNGESILESVVNKTFTITVSGPVELVAEFKGATYTVTYPTELTGGKLIVTKDSDGSDIPSGTELQKNTAITIIPEAESGYEVGSFTVNGIDRLSELQENGGEYWITIAEDVELTVTFTPLTGISGTELTGVYFDRTTSVLHAPEGSMLRVYNITGSAVFEGQGTQNLQKLSVGTYIAKVKTDNGVRTIKFIKK
ncbi:LamG-like jellyroll fold domain-containing protein [uncultured Coprobacter sp.]|uniref:LamG-like jellyroll fold domain-containing protein n=1 Tax=uncultured Coprobacter sp. TaxID=1720550 RepID=UPI0026176E5B|nr:LamG-like jellyroll fold domain-containing protein [uncultured Coprobacter sp.]